jgi:hypothetical protein
MIVSTVPPDPVVVTLTDWPVAILAEDKETEQVLGVVVAWQTPFWQVPEPPEVVEQAVLLALFTAWQAWFCTAHCLQPLIPSGGMVEQTTVSHLPLTQALSSGQLALLVQPSKVKLSGPQTPFKGPQLPR